MNSTNNYNNIHPNILNSNTNNKPSSTSNNMTTWKLTTHNIQGLNDKTKQTLWHNYCIKNNIDIAVITETQINSQTPIKYWKFKNYDSWWNNNTKGTGILLMLKKNIAHHISKIQTFSGRGTCIDLNFTKNIRIRIIGIYYPSSQNPECKQLTQ